MTRPWDYVPTGYPMGRADAEPDLAPELKLDDSAPLHETTNHAEPFERVSGRPQEQASLEERVAYLERMSELAWKAIHELRGDAGTEVSKLAQALGKRSD
jgi:hypothetical protein